MFLFHIRLVQNVWAKFITTADYLFPDRTNYRHVQFTNMCVHHLSFSVRKHSTCMFAVAQLA